MLGICPNCKIRLKEPPFNGRETNEMLLILGYRRFVEKNVSLKSLEDLGYCELCKAKKEDLEEQK